MRIVVVNTAASGGGALSILEDFVSYIRENDHDNEWHFILSGEYIQETDNIKILINKKFKSRIERIKFDFYKGKEIINQLNPDLVFSMQNTTVLGMNVPQVVYLQQSIPFQKVKRYSFIKRNEFSYAVYQYLIGHLIKKGLRHANKVIVQTEWMKNAVLSSTKVKEKNINVIPPTIDIVGGNEDIEIKGNSFFYPTSNYLYKNLNLLNEAANIIDTEYTQLSYNIDVTISERYDNQHANSIGTISREMVLEKLRSAVLVFPSYIETYGLPLAEARVVGTIIFASETDFSREVLKGYENAYFFDPFEPKDLASLMLKSIRNEIKLIRNKPILVSSNENSWEKVLNLLHETGN